MGKRKVLALLLRLGKWLFLVLGMMMATGRLDPEIPDKEEEQEEEEIARVRN